MHHRSVTLSLLASTLFAPLPAQELVAGKPAPALHVAKWVKGDPVAAFAKDRVYVVEFWATWCGPCIAGMPHLSEVQKRHAAQLTVIGVTSEDESNSLADVEAMVAAKGDTMAYTVAWDDERKTHVAWFDAAEQEGIPCCFVVDKQGTIAWIGHPQWLDTILPDVLAGAYDPAALAGKVTAIEKRLTRIFLAAQVKPATALEEAKTLLAEFPFLTDQVEPGLFSLLLEGQGAKDAWPIGERMVARAIAGKDAATLNDVAWLIVDPAAERAERNLDLAMRAASKAVEFTRSGNPNILDTLARVHAWRGEFARALELQQQALALVADDAEMTAALDGARKEYAAKVAAGGR
ncbi:MAG: redoxin domain-containing protein [Planctomycetes bacterium]|nr:redoxin domain-containing protein [Planctomycetota bacterium]